MKGHIRERSKGSWSVILYLGRDPLTGKPKQKWHTVRGTKKEAQAKLTELLHALNTGQYVEPRKLTLGAFLNDYWLPDAKNRVAGKTWEGYDDIIQNHILKADIARYKLSKVEPLHIQAYYTAKLGQDGRLDGKGALSPVTLRQHHAVLHEAFKDAVRKRMLASNPMDAVTMPRMVRREMRALDETQTAQLLNAAANGPYYIPILLAATTGMRRGELFALRWEDVDLEVGKLVVQRSVAVLRDGLSFKAPKTAKGRRRIDLPTMTVEALKRHRIQQAKERLRLGPAYQDQGLVCCKEDGQPTNPALFTGHFWHFLRRHGLPLIRLHDLRHTHASQLLRAGVHPKVVSERLGHATISITLDTYSHLLPGLQEDAAHKIDLVLRKALGE